MKNSTILLLVIYPSFRFATFVIGPIDSINVCVTLQQISRHRKPQQIGYNSKSKSFSGFQFFQRPTAVQTS